MKLSSFRLHRPRSVEEASRLLADLGDDAAPYCGGTELLLTMKLGLATYPHLVDLKQVAGLRRVERRNGSLSIGAAATHYDLETSRDLRAWCPEMVSMLSRVANLRVRSTGTLGGNLCFADPHSDPATFLVAAGATLVCQAGGDTRRVPAGQFVTGPYQTVMEPGELLVAVEVPFAAPGTGMAHVRMKLHERPVVTVAAWVRLEGGVVSDARLAVGSVGWVPLSVDVAGMLGGAGPDDFGARSAGCAAAAAEACDPLEDGEGSAEYKRHLAGVYAGRALMAAFAAAQARG